MLNKKDACRELVAHLVFQAQYWAKTDLTRPEFLTEVAKKGEVLYRLEGLVHSILATFDGVCADMPAFDLTPVESADEPRQWPRSVINDDCHLKDFLREVGWGPFSKP